MRVFLLACILPVILAGCASKPEEVIPPPPPVAPVAVAPTPIPSSPLPPMPVQGTTPTYAAPMYDPNGQCGYSSEYISRQADSNLGLGSDCKFHRKPQGAIDVESRSRQRRDDELMERSR